MTDVKQVVWDEWEAQAESIKSARWINGRLMDDSGAEVDFLEVDTSDHSILLAYGGPTAVLSPDPLARRGTFMLTVSYGDAEHSEPIQLPYLSGYIIETMGLGFHQ